MNATRAGWRPWLWAGLAVLAGGVVTILGIHLMQSRASAAARSEMRTRIASAEQQEREGHAGQALTELDEVLVLANAREVLPAAELEGVQIRRDALSLAQAEARLRAVEADTSATRALGSCLALLHASEEDRALEPLRPRLRDHAARRAEAELIEARRHADAGRIDPALDLVSRIIAICPALPSPDGPRIRDDARAVAGSILSARGVLMEPVTGHFRLGKAEDYLSEIRPVLADALRARGYQLKPSGSSAFLALWEGSAPFRLRLHVNDEAKILHFLGTPHVATRIDATLVLYRGDKEFWSTPVSARTRNVPLGMTAAEFNRLSLAGAPSRDVELKFYQDARSALHEAVVRKLSTLPEFAPTQP